MEGDDRVVQAHAALLLGVGADAGVCQGRVFVAAESKNGLVHVDGIEHAQAYQQLEVVYAQAGDFLKRVVSSLVMTSCSVFSLKSVRYTKAGMRVANLISFSWICLRLDL